MKLLLLVFLGFLMLTGCRHTPDVPLTPVLTFNKDVKQIIESCARSGCHDGNGELSELLTYQEVIKHVTPGKPYQSELFNVMVNLTYNRMPPEGNLPDDQIKTIYIWILQGAKE